MKLLIMGLLAASLGLGLVLVVPHPVNAEGITTEQADAILNELKQIRLLLESQQTQLRPNAARRPPPDQTVTLNIGDAYALGSEDAPVTLVEFTDYQCLFCSRFHRTTFPQLKKNYIDTGKVRFVSRDLPLSFHQYAFQAARSARCAGEQGKYWELRHVLSSNPKNLSKQAIAKYVQDLQLDIEQFHACVDSEKYAEEINKDIADARSVGITGTPGFVLGRTSEDGLEGIKISGAQPYAVFDARIKQLLASKK